MKGESERCPICNYLIVRLVPMQDHDQKHEGQMVCIKCKRKIKRGEKIDKFKSLS